MIQRVVSILLTLAFLIAVFVFASVLVAAALTAGALLWAWMWWRGRRGLPRGRGQVVDGEYRIIDTR
jgi:hypothetical protein